MSWRAAQQRLQGIYAVVQVKVLFARLVLLAR